VPAQKRRRDILQSFDSLDDIKKPEEEDELRLFFKVTQNAK
jgi:hypothetical protein